MRKPKRIRKIDPGKMSVEEVLAAIKKLREEGNTQKAIGRQFATPVTAQRVSQYNRLYRISDANRMQIFRAIDRRELSLDITLDELRGERDAAERYLLIRAAETKKRGKISRGLNPVREDPDGRR